MQTAEARDPVRRITSGPGAWPLVAHQTTDILGSLVFAALWLTATAMVIKLATGGLDRAGRRPLALPRRKGADHIR